MISLQRTIFFSLLFFALLTAKSQEINNKSLIYDPELNKLVERQEKPITERMLRYTPDGEDFVIMNGNKKFNRALYGTHTAFRVETGDVPEFALYLPRMGGNLTFSLSNKNKKIALNEAKQIECRYRAGSRIYTITDPILKNGKIVITALAMSSAEGLILRVEAENIPRQITLSWVFGGAADKRFSREGDLGVDPADSFELKPEYCKGNEYTLFRNSFELVFGANKDRKLIGVFPENSKLSINSLPTLNGKLKLSENKTYFFTIQLSDSNFNSSLFKTKINSYKLLKQIFNSSENARLKLASRIKIDTPDPYFNTLGGTLAVAADGIWSGKVWLHGAVGWRMPLSGWRAAYTGDVLGWHDRARTHFDAYAASQVTNIEPTKSHPTQDSTLNLARAEKAWGTQMYSNGYICRNPNENNKMHHYDMNLVYIDELLSHLNWTGDLEYAKKIWPTIESNLAWEKRNFDPDNDGLYDAYCCIWASDALYYNSGAVTHSSAYNYRANKMAADIATKIGKDPTIYKYEAEKILTALNARLWLPSKGHWAEFQDFMGMKKLHESAAIWTIYHAIDSKIQNPFQGYQATRYIDTEIPHIPVKANGLEDNDYQTISTSNWMPYAWSINNVAFAEVAHTALAYWQVGRNEEGFKLFKSSILDGMYLGASPGNVGQISYYDAARGECYRDFGDPIGMTSRALVEGLFGITPDLMNDKLLLRPGFPRSWNHASIETPDINFSFLRKANVDTYKLKQNFAKILTVDLQLNAVKDSINSITINGKPTTWRHVDGVNGSPVISITVPFINPADIEITWAGKVLANKVENTVIERNSEWTFETIAEITEIYNPQNIMSNIVRTSKKLTGIISSETGNHTFFTKLKQGQMNWWQPINLNVMQNKSEVYSAFSNVNDVKCEKINFDNLLNDSVTNIFKNKYLSPRSPYTTLQIPTQGIGEWCHPTSTAEIDDKGIRNMVFNNEIKTNLKVPFRSFTEGKNIAFTALWDNYPHSIEIPLSSSASNAYLLMAGTTNHMQSHFINGLVTVVYTDNSTDTMRLINPENWCPIEQDYFVDGIAFQLKMPRPYRLQLNSGLVSNNLSKELNITGVYGRKIEGGAATLLDMQLDKSKKLKSIKVETLANDVIIGLMSLTLQR